MPIRRCLPNKEYCLYGTLTAQNREQKQYIGVTENDFKGRYDVHINNLLTTQSMKIPRLCPNTYLGVEKS